MPPFPPSKGKKGKSSAKGRAAFAKKFGGKKSKGKPPIGESGGPTPQGSDMPMPQGPPEY